MSASGERIEPQILDNQHTGQDQGGTTSPAEAFVPGNQSDTLPSAVSNTREKDHLLSRRGESRRRFLGQAGLVFTRAAVKSVDGAGWPWDQWWNQFWSQFSPKTVEPPVAKSEEVFDPNVYTIGAGDSPVVTYKVTPTLKDTLINTVSGKQTLQPGDQFILGPETHIIRRKITDAQGKLAGYKGYVADLPVNIRSGEKEYKIVPEESQIGIATYKSSNGGDRVVLSDEFQLTQAQGIPEGAAWFKSQNGGYQLALLGQKDQVYFQPDFVTHSLFPVDGNAKAGLKDDGTPIVTTGGKTYKYNGETGEFIEISSLPLKESGKQNGFTIGVASWNINKYLMSNTGYRLLLPKEYARVQPQGVGNYSNTMRPVTIDGNKTIELPVDGGGRIFADYALDEAKQMGLQTVMEPFVENDWIVRTYEEDQTKWLYDPGYYTPDEVIAIFKKKTELLAAKLGDRVDIWTALLEMIKKDGTWADSILKKASEDKKIPFIDTVIDLLIRAHNSNPNPDAEYMWTEFGIEYENPQSDALLQHVEDINNRKRVDNKGKEVKIDIVAMEGVFDASKDINIQGMVDNIRRFQKKGVKVFISSARFNVANVKGGDAQKYKRQAAVAAQLFEVSRQTGVDLSFWGMVNGIDSFSPPGEDNRTFYTLDKNTQNLIPTPALIQFKQEIAQMN